MKLVHIIWKSIVLYLAMMLAAVTFGVEQTAKHDYFGAICIFVLCLGYHVVDALNSPAITRR